MDSETHQEIDAYVTNLFAPEDEVLRGIQAEAAQHGLPSISVRAHEGRLLQFLVYATGARTVVEIGTLAGYSGVWLGRALPADGRLYTLEKSAKHAQVARGSFERAGLLDRVEVLEGEALTLLEKLRDRGPFDLVFIDADKTSYNDYLRWAVDNLRVGGVVAAHNALRGGGVLNPENETDRAIQAFNQALAEHPRLEGTIVTMGDGLAVGVKRA